MKIDDGKGSLLLV